MGLSDAASSLVQICVVKVAQNMDVLEGKISDLPVSLLKQLLAQLNIYYLDRLESVAVSKGISTSSVWASIWRDVDQTWRCRSKSGLPGQDWKQKCLERLFHMVMFTHVRRGRSYLSNLSDLSILSMTAEHVKVLSLHGSNRDICRLTSGELRPILTALEKSVRSLKLLDTNSLLRQHGRKSVLFVLHRLLDHGCVREVVLRRSSDPAVLRWITSRCRGPQGLSSVSSAGTSQAEGAADGWISAGPDGEEPAAKRFRQSSAVEETPEVSCGTFVSSSSPTECCPHGHINSLDFEVSRCHILSTVSEMLPSWLCLHTLHLHTDWLLQEDDMLLLVEALRRLFLNPGCSLTDLTMSHVIGHSSVISVLRACPTLQSLSLEICPPLDNNTWKNTHFTLNKELCLQKLTVKSTEVPTAAESFVTVLKCSPKLTSLHITGIRQGRLLLLTLSEFNPVLRTLHLEDINLSRCHREILRLLEDSVLEGLSLKDCRLLDKCSVQKSFLMPFVKALKKVSSLQSLTLAQNRLATSVTEIADLFSGSCPSNITNLDLSSNFILPAELLAFAQLLETYRPERRLTLDLRLNPLDRDPEVKGQALRTLLPYCHVLTDDWDSSASMADHISVM